jgi:hypothetical protein
MAVGVCNETVLDSFSTFAVDCSVVSCNGAELLSSVVIMGDCKGGDSILFMCGGVGTCVLVEVRVRFKVVWVISSLGCTRSGEVSLVGADSDFCCMSSNFASIGFGGF